MIIPPCNIAGLTGAERMGGHAATVCFDLGGTLIEDPFERILDSPSMKARLCKLDECFQDPSIYEKFLVSWKHKNRTLDFPFASHFLQEESWILRALHDSGILYSSGKPAEWAPTILADYRAEAPAFIAGQPQLPAIKELFRSLRNRGVRLVVASNDREYATPAMVYWAGLEEFVEAVFTSEGLSRICPGAEKPDPRFFFEWASQLEIPRRLFDHIVYVGDSEGNDVAPAQQCGMKAIRFSGAKKQSGAVWIEETATTTAERWARSYDELPYAVEKLVSEVSRDN